jgi:hypothetical protein
MSEDRVHEDEGRAGRIETLGLCTVFLLGSGCGGAGQAITGEPADRSAGGSLAAGGNTGDSGGRASGGRPTGSGGFNPDRLITGGGGASQGGSSGDTARDGGRPGAGGASGRAGAGGSSGRAGAGGSVGGKRSCNVDGASTPEVPAHLADVTSHRVAAVACAESTGPFMDSCRSKSDCGSDANVHCTAGHLCSYDECTLDDTCGANGVCSCRAQSGAPGNVCVPGDCHMDGDCPAEQLCSPSMEYGTIAGYYCHTSCDRCHADADCESGLACAYSTDLEFWDCRSFVMP